MNHGGGSSRSDRFKPIGEGKEGVRGGDAVPERQHSLHCAEPGGIYAAHLSCAYAQGLAVPGVDDGVRLDVLADAPRKQQAA